MSASLGASDIAIVGGGLIGTAAAYYLAKGGVDVVLLERSGLNQEASGTNAGSLHLQIYIHPTFPDDYIERILPSVALLREAAANWAGIESELDADCGVRLGGGLWVAETDAEMALIDKKVRAENSMGVGSEVLSRQALLDLAPYLGPTIIGGSFLHGEGFANPLLVTGAFARAALDAGARIFSDAEVCSIERRSGGGFTLETGIGPLSAGQVVSAGGAWTPRITRMLGVEVPVHAGVAQVNVTEARPPIMRDQLLQHVGRGLTLKQAPTGGFIIGGGWPGDYDAVNKRKVPALDSIVGNAWVAARTVPELADAQIVRSWAGMGSSLDDGMPVIGETGAVKGFHVLYHQLGFTVGPTTAQLFSQRYLTGDSAIPLEPFTPDRF
jgi:glycine/D-amino acid oxidase-like deaminating enzyme